MIRNVILDWSGTLVDDLPAVWRATNFVLGQAGRGELTLEQFRAEFCLPFTRFYERYTPHIPIGQLEQWFHSRFREVQDSVIELPQARGFLQFCQERGLRVFVLSTIHRDYYARQTAGNGFHKFVERAYLEIWNKREQIHTLLAENKLAPDETLYVGDMEHDIETAKYGGVFSCAVLTGYNTLPQLRAAGADLIVEHLGELRHLLLRHNLEIKARPDSPGEAEREPHRLPIPTVGALIFNHQKQVLMIRTQKWSNRWGIPGGKIKFGESSLEALCRELNEETNLEVYDIEFVLVQDCIRSEEFYRDEHFILLNYTCHCREGVVKLNHEAVEFRWVPLLEALAMDLNQPTRILIDTYLAKQAAK